MSSQSGCPNGQPFVLPSSPMEVEHLPRRVKRTPARRDVAGTGCMVSDDPPISRCDVQFVASPLIDRLPTNHQRIAAQASRSPIKKLNTKRTRD